MQGIYRIKNKLNGMGYIGSARNLEEGLEERQRRLEAGRHGNPYLQRAWNKYGKENFVFEVMEKVEGDQLVLFASEQVYLNEGFALGTLYNVARVAGGGDLGREVNQKIRAGLKKYFETHDSAFKGKHHTEEAKLQMSECKKGVKNPFYGKAHTEETISKMKHNEYGAKPHPAFYNDFTGQYIMSGRNLQGTCREYGLSQAVMWYLKEGITRRTRDGWRMAHTL